MTELARADIIPMTARADMTPPRQLDPSDFTDFVTWLDRGERTTKTYLSNLKRFWNWMQDEGITMPTRADVIKYRQHLADSGYSGNTCTGYLRTVKQFFRWAQQQGLYADIAAEIRAPKVDHSTPRKDALTPEEVRAISESIDAQAAAKTTAAAGNRKDAKGRMQRADEQGKRDRALFEVCINMGLRCTELNRANVKDIEIRNGRAFLYIWGKGHSEADTRKPLANEVMDIIADYLDARHDGCPQNSPLFVSTSNRNNGGRIDPKTISGILKRQLQAAGFDSARLTAHSLRHTAGTSVQEITGDIFQTQHYLRHSSPTTTQIYLHNDQERQEAETADRLYHYYHDGPEAATEDRADDLAARLHGLTADQLAQIAAIINNGAAV